MARIVVIQNKREAMPTSICVFVRNGIQLPTVGERVFLEINGDLSKVVRVKSVNPDERTYTIPVS